MTILFTRSMSRFILSALCLISISLSAQEDQPKSTIFGESSVNIEDLGFFIAPQFGITSLDEDPASLFHLRGGITLKDRFSLGAFFNTSLNEVFPESETVQNIYLDYWAVGGFFEYTLLANRAIHVSMPLMIGHGEVQMDDEMGNNSFGEANFLQIEPAVLLELNLHQNLRFNIGAGYRIVNSMSYRNFDQSDISGFTGYAGLKLDIFR